MERIPLFGTVILDAYKKDEAEEMASAIDELFCPNDTYGWASAGIYSFWDYNTNEILYIGLASDLYERFRQHNGLLPISLNSCKFSQIQEYFKNHSKLGYTVFVQSILAQPIIHRNKELYQSIALEEDYSSENSVNTQGIADIKIVEGILIESYRKTYGHFPPWNKVGGSIKGQNHVMHYNINIVRSFCNPKMYKGNPIISRATIRELASNPSYVHYENYLHGVRMQMLKYGIDYSHALEILNRSDPFNCYKRIIDEGYLNKQLIL